MTYKEIVDDALEACSYDATAATSAARSRIKRFVNFWHRRFLTRPTLLRFLRDVQAFPLTSVAGQAVYGLPIALGRLVGVHEDTNDVQLVQRDLKWLRTEDPGLTAAGTPLVYVPLGWRPIHTLPSTPDDVWLKLSGSGTEVVQWQAIRATGEIIHGTTTLTGTTAVQMGTATDLIDIVSLSLSAANASATLTVHQSTGTGTELGRVPAGVVSARYFQIQLWPTPAAAWTYYVDFERELVDLVHDSETPLLPPDFHDLLSLGAQIEEWTRKDDIPRMQIAERRLMLRERDLTTWLWNLPDTMPGTRNEPRYSRLGAWFPAGS